MQLSRLIPVCLISVLMGSLLPRLFPNPTHLFAAAAAYLAVLFAADRMFGSRPESD